MEKLKKILLVDDEVIDNFINSRILAKMGVTESVEVCTNGIEAIEYLKSCERSSKALPELIFLDLNMPLSDGYDFLQQFEQLDLYKKFEVTIVILTTSTVSKEIEKLREMGYGTISKPLTEKKMLNIVNNFFDIQH